MEATESALSLIREFEGLRTTAYKCPAGVWTIGYGHTEGVKEGDRVTEAGAWDLLRSDAERFAKRLTDVLTGNGIAGAINQREFDALVSFVYNVGIGAFVKSSVMRFLKQGDHESAGDAMLRWVYAGGKVLQGLVRRRSAERRLFLS